MRFIAFVLALTCAPPLLPTTLERLSMEQLVGSATAIVRGKVGSCAGELRSNVVYTRCDVTVSETWKGASDGKTMVWIPGGRAGAYRQTFSGTPQLSAGQEYVLFLWAGRSGLNQLIGLTQGVFELRPDGKIIMAERAATAERMVDAQGNEVQDQPVRYTASELKRIVNGHLARAAQ